jgi:hypothetical protein
MKLNQYIISFFDVCVVAEQIWEAASQFIRMQIQLGLGHEGSIAVVV